VKLPVLCTSCKITLFSFSVCFNIRTLIAVLAAMMLQRIFIYYQRRPANNRRIIFTTKTFFMERLLGIGVIFLSLHMHAQEVFTRVNTGTNAEFNKRNTGVKDFGSIQDNKPDEDIIEKKDKPVQINPEILKRGNLFEKRDNETNIGSIKNIPTPLISKNVFFPDLGGVDPMIAAGHNYLVISQDHSFVFYNKNGFQLAEKVGGIKVKWSATDFFQPVIDAANNNSFAMLQTAPDDILTKCQSDGNTGSCKLLCEAYDTRVIYEPGNKRFIITSAVRNTSWHDDDYPELCNTYSIRIFVFAISNTEDPRDGFKMWYWTKNNYRDWPRISADKDVLTVAHNGDGADGTPAIYAISMEDLMNGVNNPRWFTYRKGVGNTPGSVIPVNKYKSTNTSFDNYVMFLKADGDNAILYYYKKSAGMWNNKPELQETEIDLENDISLSWHERPVYRNGCIYFSSIVKTADAFPNFRPKIYGFDLYRLPLKKDGNDIEFNESSSRKMEYPVYPMDATTLEFISYELPSIAVDERGTLLTAYGRWGKKNSGDIFPEARYFLFYENENGHRPSKALKTGGYMPMFTPKGTNTPVPDGFYNYGDATDKFADYTTVTADPEDRFVFWIAHVYADEKDSKYKMVVGKVGAY
jgi:hypothetical protein